MKEWQEIHGVARNELTLADRDFQGDSHRANALAYYQGTEVAALDRLVIDPETGQAKRSLVNSGVIYDVVNAILDEALPAMQTDLLAEFDASSDQDLQQVYRESVVVNNLLMQQNPGRLVLQEALHDALLMRNGIARVWVEERIETSVQELEGVSEAQRFQITQDAMQRRGSDDELEIESVELMQQLPQTQRFNGVDVMLGYARFYRMQVKRWTRRKKLRVRAWPPEQVRVKATTRAVDLRDCDFIAFEWPMSRAEAKNIGFPPDVVDRIPHRSQAGTNPTAVQRDRRAFSDRNPSTDTDLQQISLFETYMRFDEDEDGQAELLKVWLGGHEGEVYISHERTDYIGACAGVTRVNPHRFEGDSVHDSHRHIHDAQRGIVRAWQDNLAQALERRKLVNAHNLENPDDIHDESTDVKLFVKPGKDPRSIIAQEEFVDASASALAGLQWWNDKIATRGGASVNLISEAVPVGGASAHGVERQQSSAELPSERMISTFFDTFVREIFKLVHHVARVEFQGELTAKSSSGEFIHEDPRFWQPRENVSVHACATLGNRLRLLSAANQRLETMLELMANPKTESLVNHSKLHAALVDRDQAAGLPNAAMAYVDPQGPEGQQIAEQQRQQQAEVAAKQQEIERLQSQLATAMADAQTATAQAKQMEAQLKQQKMIVDMVGESVDQQIDRERIALDRDEGLRDDAIELLKLGSEAEQAKRIAGRLN